MMNYQIMVQIYAPFYSSSKIHKIELITSIVIILAIVMKTKVISKIQIFIALLIIKNGYHY